MLRTSLPGPEGHREGWWVLTEQWGPEGPETGLACQEERSDGGGLGSAPSSDSQEEAEHASFLSQADFCVPRHYAWHNLCLWEVPSLFLRSP